MTVLADLFDRDELDVMLSAGYVRHQTHPTLPLAILNYTEQAVYDRAWNATTRQCRGLIYKVGTTEVVARPFPKFFNHGEPDAPDLDLAAEVVVTDKLDGSLGILYPTSDGEYAIATRGSFTSEQALWATDWLREHVPPSVFDPSLSYLFEILAKWNRVVVDYDFEGLVLLAVRETETGRDLDLPDGAGVLPSRTPRDDAGEHLRPAEDGLEDVPRLPERELPQGSRAPRREAEGDDEDMARREPGSGERAPSRGAAEDPGRAERGEGRSSMRGLRADLPERLHGLRPCPGEEGLQRGPSEDAPTAPGGDREVRVGLRELPSDQDRDEARARILRAFGVTEEEVAAYDLGSGYAAAREEADLQQARFVEWARGRADELSKVMTVALFVPVVERYSYRTLAEALAAEPRPGAEGLVVYLLDTDVRVKLKQDDFVALHRILTGTNARHVWEFAAVRACRDAILRTCSERGDEGKHWASYVGLDPARVEQLLAAGDGWLTAEEIPDEFYGWVRGVIDEVEEKAGQAALDGLLLAGEAAKIKDRRERYEFVEARAGAYVREVMRVASMADGGGSEAMDALLFRAWREVCPEPTAPFARPEAIA